MKFESAHPDDFNEIQNLYLDLIDKVNKIHKHIANQRGVKFTREDNHEYLIDKQ